jgi:hypothetical protein
MVGYSHGQRSFSGSTSRAPSTLTGINVSDDNMGTLTSKELSTGLTNTLANRKVSRGNNENKWQRKQRLTQNQ